MIYLVTVLSVADVAYLVRVQQNQARYNGGCAGRDKALSKSENILHQAGVCLKGGERIRADFVIETSGANCQAVVDVLESKGCGQCESSIIDPGTPEAIALLYVLKFAKPSKSVETSTDQQLVAFFKLNVEINF